MLISDQLVIVLRSRRDLAGGFRVSGRSAKIMLYSLPSAFEHRQAKVASYQSLRDRAVQTFFVLYILLLGKVLPPFCASPDPAQHSS